MEVQLLVVQGRPHGKCLTFPHGEFVFGRGQECHVRPDSPTVSRQHCLLRVEADRVHIRDLGSTNGTLVNGTLVVGERALADGDLIAIGPLVLQFRVPRPDSEAQSDSLSTFVDSAQLTQVLPPGFVPPTDEAPTPARPREQTEPSASS
jgi:pSer/pThr/pTyr-binding forkhead associated (FHA) protein